VDHMGKITNSLTGRKKRTAPRGWWKGRELAIGEAASTWGRSDKHAELEIKRAFHLPITLLLRSRRAGLHPHQTEDEAEVWRLIFLVNA